MALPWRVFLFSLVVLGLGLGYSPPIDAAQAIAPAETAAPLFYTIQIGRFSTEEEALAWFNRLAEQLPTDRKQFLRVEAVPPFHAVRVGKADSRQDLAPLLAETEKIVTDTPAILHVPYRTEQITKLYDASPAPQKSAAPAEGQGESPSLPDNREESLDTHEAEGTPKAKPARRTKPAEVQAQPAAPAPMPDATLKKMIIDKYLDSPSLKSSKEQEAIIKQSQSFPESPTCITAQCHAATKSFTNAHYPAQTGRCLACHKQVNQQHPGANGADFQLLAKGAALCNTCHPKLQGKKYGHAPAAEGECLQCHAPHGSDNKFLLSVPAAAQDKLCLQCHDEQITANKFTHGPVGLGACTYCHAPHESDYKGLLKSDLETLCFECHSDIAAGVKASTSIHEVVRTEGCTSCHQPHGSEFPSLLKQSGEEFCFTCHPDIKDKYEKSRSKHAGLFLEKQCGTCHQPHYSSYEKLLNSKELDLCLSCHSEQSSISSKSPKDISLELKQTYLHEPLAQGQCAVCHDPHGSKFDKLLIGPYPDDIYASYSPEIYDLCFTCHDKELLTSQTTDTATSFRNGSQNLHYFHAAIPQKGRTCRTCHQSHASNGPKLINQSGSSFGEWQMSISFSTTGNGGSCMPGCHRKMEYNRDQKVDNSGKESEFGQSHIEYKSAQ